MNDPISRADLFDELNRRGVPYNAEVNMVINGMQSVQPEPLTVNFAGETDRETIEKLKEGLKNAPVQIMAINDSAQQWIPCSERLPEEYGEYRITWTTSDSKNRLIGDAEYEVTGEWDEVNGRFKGEWLLDEYIKDYPNVKVLAWKPLEEPWKGEQP